MQPTDFNRMVFLAKAHTAMSLFRAPDAPPERPVCAKCGREIQPGEPYSWDGVEAKHHACPKPGTE